MPIWPFRSTPPPPPPVPQPDPDHRIYAIGDVHGRHDLLDALLQKLEADASTADADGRIPILVFLGDLVDRGDQSRKVLDLAIAAMLTWPHSVCLRGNHEDALLRFLGDPESGRGWLGFGGAQTLASYQVAPPRAGPSQTADLRRCAAELEAAMGAHATFLQQTELSFRSGHVVCSHSGLDPDMPPEQQGSDALLWGRSRFLEVGPPPGLRSVHGHWDNPEPVVTPQRICVDTGAYYSGCLTAVRIDAETHLIRADMSDL